MKPIESKPQSIYDMFTRYEFIIPNFQRRYSWDKDDCEKLWDDVLSHIEPNSKQVEYYLGCIVVYPEKDNNKRWNIIDGQQRITTLLMLINVLFSRANTYEELATMMYKKDEYTGEIKKDTPRLVSEVIGDSGTNDLNDFNMVMINSLAKLKKNKLLKKNLFLSNYDYIDGLVEEWVNKKFRADPNGLKKNIKRIVDGLVMLPLECPSQEDALNLFESINNRGKNLTDADIFKSKMHQKYSKKDKEKFVKRWGMLGDERRIGDLFFSYMHIQRASDDEPSTRIKLRGYITDQLKNASSEGADDILRKIEKINAIIKIVEDKKSICTNKSLQSKELIYWHILSKYSNVYYRYPLFSFITKYGDFSDGRFKLEDERQGEYINLLENTIRYFYIRGVVYNFLDSVREASYQASVAIYKEKDYVNVYKKDVYKKYVNGGNDVQTFCEKIDSSNYGKRYRSGLVLLNSFLNKEQEDDLYAKVLGGKYDIEHILPKSWNNYYEWDEDSHKNHIERMGNLIPLEKELNTKASNKLFKLKQEIYASSEVLDALVLSKKEPKTWKLDDVEGRHEKSIERLREFFGDFK